MNTGDTHHLKCIEGDHELWYPEQNLPMAAEMSEVLKPESIGTCAEFCHLSDYSASKQKCEAGACYGHSPSWRMERAFIHLVDKEPEELQGNCL